MAATSQTALTATQSDRPVPFLLDRDGKVSDEDKRVWRELVWQLYMFAQEQQRQSNVTVSVPQLLSLLVFVCDVSKHEVAKKLKTRLFHMASDANLSEVCSYLRRYERGLREDGQHWYTAGRRLVTDSRHSKTYSLSTMIALQTLQFELSLLHADTHIGPYQKEWLTARLRLPPAFELEERPFNIERRTVSQNKFLLATCASCLCLRLPADAISDRAQIKFRTDDDVTPVPAVKVRAQPEGKKPIRALPWNTRWQLVELPCVENRLKLFLLVSNDLKKPQTLETGKFHEEIIGQLLGGAKAKQYDSVWLPNLVVAPTNCRALQLQSVLKSQEMASMFDPDSLCDLMPEGGALFSVQMLDILLLSTGESEPLQSSRVLASPSDVGKDDLLVCVPFHIIVWDTSESLPLFFAKVNGAEQQHKKDKPKSPERTSSTTTKDLKKKKCNIM